MVLAGNRAKRYERAATPLFLIAAILVQQSATFWSKRLTLFTFSATLFGCILLAHLFDVWNFEGKLIGVVLGVPLICIAYALQQSRHLAIASFWYFLGAVLLMWSVFETVENTPFELLYLGLSALLIFVSTTVRSRALLTVSTLSMLVYIGYYTAEHFANTLGWPIALVVIGVALIGISSMAVKLNNKYIKTNS